MPSRMKLTKNPVFLIITTKLWGSCYLFWNILTFPCFWRWKNGFSWPAKIMAGPFNKMHPNLNSKYGMDILNGGKIECALMSSDSAPRNLKRGIGSLFDPCDNAMGWRPYCPSCMEVSYCTFGFGMIIRHDLHILLLPHDSLHDHA